METTWSLQPDKLRPDGHGGFHWAWLKDPPAGTRVTSPPSGEVEEEMPKKDSIVPPLVPAKMLYVKGKGGSLRSRPIKGQPAKVKTDTLPSSPQRRARTSHSSSASSPSNVDDATQKFFSTPSLADTKKARGGADKLPSAVDERRKAPTRPKTNPTKLASPSRVSSSPSLNRTMSSASTTRTHKPITRRSLSFGAANAASAASTSSNNAERAKWYAINHIMRLQEQALCNQFVEACAVADAGADSTA